MSYAETPVPSQADQILENQQMILDNQRKIMGALDGLGGNMQWLVDNVKGIFEMFGNPQMMSMMQGMMPDMGAISDGLANQSSGRSERRNRH